MSDGVWAESDERELGRWGCAVLPQRSEEAEGAEFFLTTESTEYTEPECGGLMGERETARLI